MDMVKTLPENTKGRDFIIGDIHGIYEYLDQALKDANFDPDADRLISVGDLVDRGPQSYRSIEFLKQPWFHAVKGNHEQMFLDYCTAYDTHGSMKAEFNIQANMMEWVRDLSEEQRVELRDAFAELPIAMEIETAIGKVGIVHADIPETMNWQEFTDKLNAGNAAVIDFSMMARIRTTRKNEDGVDGIERVFFGHTPQKNGIMVLGNCYYVDTGAIYKMRRNNEGVESGFLLTLADITASDEELLSLKGSANKRHVFDIITKAPQP